VIEVTAWARDILARAYQAARRFNPDARIRVARVGNAVEAMLAAASDPGDQEVPVEDMTVYVEEGLEGLLDVEEPHDRLILRPLGSTPNVRGH
jgi:hypothetical protein